MPCIVHVRVMRYISGNWLSNLIDVRMSPLNFQVIAEIKVCVVKDVITNGTGCSLNDHWVRIRDALIIKIFSRSLGKAKAKRNIYEDSLKIISLFSKFWHFKLPMW